MERTGVGKDKTISIRVSGKEKKKITEKAKKENKSISEYVADSAIAGLERKNGKDKKRVAQMVRNQEILNDIFRQMWETETGGELYEKIMELTEGEKELWQCL